jgi:ADP-ribose pyrophosphatase YjhB (NUDIX family)
MKASNPVPVAVALVPHKDKLIGIRRGIEPRLGQIALPGGYIHSGEKFVDALSRELLEETGIQLSPKNFSVFHVGDSLQSDRILLFGVSRVSAEVDMNFRSSETQEIVLIDENTPLAFPLHDEARRMYFERMKG